MVLKNARRVASSSLLLASVCLAVTQPQRAAYEPASPGSPVKPNQSFVDFTLKRINPSDKDYGQSLEQSRKLILQETIQNGLFWSNMVTLSLLGCLFVIVGYQHRQRVRREWTIAEILQQCENSLLRANAQVDDTTKRNHELFEALTAARENAFPSTILLTEDRQIPARRTTAKRTAETQTGEPTATTPTAAITVASGKENGNKPANQMGLSRPEVDLMLKLNSLEQQLGRSQEQEKQLRRQLTQADIRLQTEQQKNRALKGA
jgi:hypothetical protein